MHCVGYVLSMKDAAADVALGEDGNFFVDLELFERLMSFR
jgi:hypothetical protein